MTFPRERPPQRSPSLGMSLLSVSPTKGALSKYSEKREGPELEWALEASPRTGLVLGAFLAMVLEQALEVSLELALEVSPELALEVSPELALEVSLVLALEVSPELAFPLQPKQPLRLKLPSTVSGPALPTPSPCPPPPPAPQELSTGHSSVLQVLEELEPWEGWCQVLCQVQCQAACQGSTEAQEGQGGSRGPGVVLRTSELRLDLHVRPRLQHKVVAQEKLLWGILGGLRGGSGAGDGSPFPVFTHPGVGTPVAAAAKAAAKAAQFALLSGPLLRGWSYSDGGDSPRLGSSDQLWGLVTFQIGEAAQGGPGEHSPAHRPPPQLNPARILGSMLGSSHVSLSD
ncbi:Hypothetical predicted protein [Marmota monax]|uniref:Uncharacterized protein n=1 Tax=Marmota monax TaxID=9995 RepID=A0A5E4AH29_MARMO|nr:hypothetical protein GHT09_006191 [Marmota monax]VTJ56548.1 Hypothetical predicted protein [Marmota monax]